jgi:tRNA 2-selenouridine synthase
VTSVNHTFASIEQLSAFDAVIDARSPGEFALDHIPGAINCPVLDDEERIRVGTLYKQVSPFEARKVGAVLVARNVARHIETLFAAQPKSWRPLVYCWRGGQRSGSFTHILNEVGWTARRLSGGYKSWRHHVLEALQTLPGRFRFEVLAGPTGSGKTKVLEALQAQGQQVLNLEALAAHKGSVLGGLPDQVQPSQKMFETQILHTLSAFDPARPVYVEAESKRIGLLRLPDAVYQGIQQGQWLGLQVPVAARVRFLLQDYAYFLHSPVLIAQLDRLAATCGKVQVDLWKAAIANGHYEALVEDLLVKHYDRYYDRSMRQLQSADAQGRVLGTADVSDAGFMELAQRIVQRTEITRAS